MRAGCQAVGERGQDCGFGEVFEESVHKTEGGLRPLGEMALRLLLGLLLLRRLLGGFLDAAFLTRHRSSFVVADDTSILRSVKQRWRRIRRLRSLSAGDLVGTIRTELASVRSDFSSTAGNLNRLAARLDTFVRIIDTSSTAVKLVSSDELYDEVRQTNLELQNLIADVKANPEKYIKVDFTLFK